VTSEFDIIHRYFTRPNHALLGIGDDAALIKPTAGLELAISTDTLVSGQHFFPDTDPYMLGHKSLAVNLSDMAAMGAKPCWATLALTIPRDLLNHNELWLAAFANGFFKLAQQHQVGLIGGDTTCGPLNICVQIIGEVKKGKALRRSGAKPGDDIWISGHLGDAALALAHQQQRIQLTPTEIKACLPALHTPEPRISLGRRLISVAHSAIDISDGLMADLEHMLTNSNVAATINMNDLACSETLNNYLPQPLAISCLLSGGDDYELCFTAAKTKQSEIEKLAIELSIPLTRIGKITPGKGLRVLDTNGKVIKLETKGYDHFHAG
jgi:thiamine-monophosphate kinase